MTLVLRPARLTAADAAFFAWAMDEAAGGLMQDVMGARSARVLAAVGLRPGHSLSLEHVTLAELDGRTVGMVSGMRPDAPGAGDPASAILRSIGLGIFRAALVYLAVHPLVAFMDRHEPDEWYLQAVAVEPAARGAGVGRALLAHAEGLAAASGARRLALHVDTANTGARRLYERVGFRTVETSPPARFAGGAAAHRMVRDLADPGAGRG